MGLIPLKDVNLTDNEMNHCFDLIDKNSDCSFFIVRTNIKCGSGSDDFYRLLKKDCSDKVYVGTPAQISKLLGGK
jgi:hypothetical protein